MSTLKILLLIVLVVVFIAGGRWYNSYLDNQAAEKSRAEEAATQAAEAKLLSSIHIQDLVLGTGPEAKRGDTLSVNYLGEFLDGKKFDSSYDRHQPFEFVLGAGNVIKGWDLGLAGMKVGGKRALVIPPELAYGSEGRGIIPPSSTLKFTVELLGVNGSTSTSRQ